jgi:hypothetical protein
MRKEIFLDPDSQVTLPRSKLLKELFAVAIATARFGFKSGTVACFLRSCAAASEVVHLVWSGPYYAEWAEKTMLLCDTVRSPQSAEP